MTHPPRNKNKIFMISLYLGLHSKTNLTHGIAVKINAQSSPLYLQRYTQYPEATVERQKYPPLPLPSPVPMPG